jgi:hypothetical protein
MKKRLFLFASIAALALYVGAKVSADKGDGKTPAPAEQSPKIAASKIIHVTVYPNSALITREVELPAGTGTVEVVVNPLPPQTLDSSLYSEGSDGLRILSTRYRRRPIREDTREEVRKLQDEIRNNMLKGQKLQGDLLAVQQNMAMVGKLEDFTAVSNKTGDKSPLNSESIIALSKYVMESRAAKAKEVVTLQQDIQTNNEQMEFLRRQLQDVSAGTSKVEHDAVIVVDKVNAAAGKIRLNYLVTAASWHPQYKFRAGKDEKENVQLEYLAAVIQHTGEPWNNVGLTLSTAQPMLNAAPPDLAVLNVMVVPKGGVPAQTAQNMMNPSKEDFFQKAQGNRAAAQQEYLKKDIQNAAKLYNEAAALEANWDLLHATRDEALAFRGMRGFSPNSNEGPSVTYHLPAKLTVPSRNDEQVIEVGKINMEPEYYYKAVPVLTSHVYRQANLTNKSNYVLLPGEATMYQGTDFVGRMSVPLVAIGEQFTVGFGVDPQLQVARALIDKTRTTQGGNQVLKYEYRILVNSYKSQAVSLQLWDRLPLAEMESVGVAMQKCSPDLSKDSLYLRENKPQNLLRWDLKIDPAMNGEKAYAVNYEFQMALDRQMTIADFKTKEPLPAMKR